MAHLVIKKAIPKDENSVLILENLPPKYTASRQSRPLASASRIEIFQTKEDKIGGDLLGASGRL